MSLIRETEMKRLVHEKGLALEFQGAASIRNHRQLNANPTDGKSDKFITTGYGRKQQTTYSDTIRSHYRAVRVFGIIVLGKLFSTTVIEASDWNRRAKEELSRVDTIAPERGNILADNGNILACNLKVYDIKIDLRHVKRLIPTYARKNRGIPWNKIDSLPTP